MPRIMLKVAYDGTNYSGWQVQPGEKTIEGCLNDAITRLTQKETHVIGASRTDAGVHSKGSACVFDYEGTIPAEKFPHAIAPYLPEDIVVVDSLVVPDDFHPRKTDTRKTYVYTFDNNEFPNPMKRLYSWHIKRPLDVDKMNQAAKILLGEHDFASFCCVKTQAESTVRTIYELYIEEKDDKTVTLTVTGNGFLYNMVRIIAGTLSQVGTGLWEVEKVKEVLEATNRTKGGITAPASGLRLENIEFLELKNN